MVRNCTPIIVNGVEIADSAIHAEMRHHPAPSPEAAEYSAKLALVAKIAATRSGPTGDCRR